MKITVKRSGGFAGLTENVADLDTSQLARETAEKISAKVASVGFFDYPAEVAGGAVGADMYRYEITVTDGTRHHSVSFAESVAAAAALLDLVHTLQAI